MENLIMLGFGGLFLGVVAGYAIRMIVGKFQIGSAESAAKKILAEASREAQTKKKEGVLEVKEEMHKSRVEFDKETRERRQELQRLEKRLIQKEENLDHKVDILDKKEREIVNKERSLGSRDKALKEEEQKLTRNAEEQKKILERMANMSSAEAKKILMTQMEEEATRDGAVMIKRIEQQTKEEASKKAKEIIGIAIQRYAADHTAEITVTTVPLPGDEMKGRIIGREGRNIRALETITGVDLIIDDTPEAITLSSFDGVRREIARISLERLISDGRIHPGRIEEVVGKVQKEMEEKLREIGDEATFEMGLSNIHPEIIKLLGRLKYRTSYGQNVLQHAKEVAALSGVMAAELGVNVQLAKRAGLLHDIGKAVSHEVEGTHTKIGADMAKKYGENAKVINAIAAHHEDVETNSIEAVIVGAADAISAARPGVRRESLEHYIKRLENLEKLADSFRGVEKSYAIQAGREIRIIVDADAVDDVIASQLARDIAKKIEKELEYPGQVKVTVIREVRAVEVAK
ncbi:MAG: ribonuclease Y [bacterium]